MIIIDYIFVGGHKQRDKNAAATSVCKVQGSVVKNKG